MTCDFTWVGPMSWWCHLDAPGQAAWLQAIVSILALAVAVYLPWRERNTTQLEKQAEHRRLVMSAAAVLDIELEYESIVLNFAPLGDGTIEYELTLSEAKAFMQLRPEAQAAIQRAVEKAHYFDEDLCEHIVRLGVEAAAYDRIIEDRAKRNPNQKVDAFFKSLQPTTEKLQSRMNGVRDRLKKYLPIGPGV